MTTAILRAKRALLATGAAAALIMIASTANAGCRWGEDDDGNRVQLCTSGGSYATYDEDEDDDEDYEDEDEDEFIYDTNQGSLLVDQSDCAPGKYWMMYTDMAEDVMMPCR
jgi:hypothetical protein